MPNRQRDLERCTGVMSRALIDQNVLPASLQSYVLQWVEIRFLIVINILKLKNCINYEYIFLFF